MNKSRRMFSLLADAAADHGIATMLFDLSGTGDSSGDFAQASWPLWKGDLECAVNYLLENGMETIHLLGLRLAALLAADFLQQNQTKPAAERIKSLILWQPVLKGEMMLNQFLRLRLAANMMSSGGHKETTKSLRQTAKEQGFVEIAGYDLSLELIQQLDALQLVPLLTAAGSRIHWYEMVAAEGRDLSVASKKAIAELEDKGVRISASSVVGDNFWNTQEITVSQALIDKTLGALQ